MAPIRTLFLARPTETLATYPHVVIRIACRRCKRRGSYRLARLAERYGANTTIEALLRTVRRIVASSDRTGRLGCRAAYFPDLDWPVLAGRRAKSAAARHCGPAGTHDRRNDPMVYGKGELSKSAIDRGWPHQIALSAERCRGSNYTILRQFSYGASLCRAGTPSAATMSTWWFSASPNASKPSVFNNDSAVR
ncbi:MAG TPA: hypothetical protein VGF29_03655 [Hyphomicrobiaceae bacterium]